MNIKDLETGLKIDVKIDDYVHRGVTVQWLSKFKDVCEARHDNNTPVMFDKTENYKITIHDPDTKHLVDKMMSKIDFEYFHVVGGRQSDMHSEVSHHPRDFIKMALEKWIDEGYIEEGE